MKMARVARQFVVVSYLLQPYPVLPVAAGLLRHTQFGTMVISCP